MFEYVMLHIYIFFVHCLIVPFAAQFVTLFALSFDLAAALLTKRCLFRNVLKRFLSVLYSYYKVDGGLNVFCQNKNVIFAKAV